MTSDQTRGLAWTLTLALVGFASPATGCSPSVSGENYERPTLETFAQRHFAGATHVADVRVITVTNDFQKLLRSVLYERVNSFKGNLPERGAFVQRIQACDHIIERFERGNVQMVFLSKDLVSVYEIDFFVPHSKETVSEFIRKMSAQKEKQ